MVDKIINERYIVHHELGSGGMGVVYLAQDTLTDTKVAVKVLKTEIAQAEMIERFKREGEALRDLNHPNIVKMLDAFERDGQHYLVMEYVAGNDLSHLLRREQLPLEDILNLSIDLADALTRAHRLNIIHRDLKPANILIGDDGVIRLTDFGVAHVGSKERVTETEAIIGTVDYLPPEAFDGTIFDERGDIWAFGVILFEMLTGQRPFAGNSLFEVIQAISTHPIPDLEALNPDCPIALVDLVYRMLERDPQARIPSVRIIGSELEGILEGRDKAPQVTRFFTPPPINQYQLKHNLPAQVTAFVGREHELAELEKLLKDPTIRLITILAQGGMGKTRLCLELGQGAIDQKLYADGVYFVELAPLSDADNIPNAIVEACGFQFLGDGSPKQQLLNIIRDRNLLLLMDNYEHLPDGFAMVGDILKSAPNVYIVTTSRQRLSQNGETIFHLFGMDFPEWETADDALEYAAIKLFVNSAQRVRPDFELTGDYLDIIAQICKLVEGMPLGIVLAASWLAVLSLSEIVDEIQNGLDFLETDETDLPARQRSIRAVMDYSWVQMTELEQDVFMKLSVFRGGFTREAAQDVADANLRILMALVNKSLIRRDADTGRYEIHELLRQYTTDKLNHTPMLKDEILDRHCLYYIGLLHKHEDTLHLTTRHEIMMEIDNFRMAWVRAIHLQNGRVIHHAITGLFWLYHFRSWSNEGATMFLLAEEAVSQWSITDDSRLLLGILSIYRCYYEQKKPSDKQNDIQSALALWEGLEDCYEMSLPLCHALLIGSVQSEPEQIISLAHRSLALSKKYGNLTHIIIAQVALAKLMYTATGEIAEARKLIAEALILDQQIHFDLNGRWCEYILSNIDYLEGNYKEAKAHINASINYCRIASISRGLEVYLIELGKISFELNDHNIAKVSFVEGIERATSIQLYVEVASGRAGLAMVTMFEGDRNKAIASFEECLDYMESMGINSLRESEHYEYIAFVALLLGQYDYAVNYYEASLETKLISNYRVPVMLNYSRLGHALLGTGDETQAQSYLFIALYEAMEMGLFQIFLEALMGIAHLSVLPDLISVEVLTFIRLHPASNRFSRHRAEELLIRLESLLSQSEFLEAQDRGQALLLETAIELVEPYCPNLDL